MSGSPQRASFDGGWVRRPRLWRVLAAGWGIFAFVDVMSRLRVYEDAAIAFGVSLVLDPLIFLLAAGLYGIFKPAWLRRPHHVRRAALDPGPQPVRIGHGGHRRRHHSIQLRTSHGRVGPPLRPWRCHGPLLPHLHHLEPALLLDPGRGGATSRGDAVEAEAGSADRAAMAARLQLDPHFLFNALNGIGGDPGAPEGRARDVA